MAGRLFYKKNISSHIWKAPQWVKPLDGKKANHEPKVVSRLRDLEKKNNKIYLEDHPT